MLVGGEEPLLLWYIRETAPEFDCDGKFAERRRTPVNSSRQSWNETAPDLHSLKPLGWAGQISGSVREAE